MDFLTPSLDPTSAALVRAKLDEFAQKYNEQVVHQQIPWGVFWSELVNVSVHHLGADVAEIGSTQVEPLIAMNVLEAFSREEIQLIGGEQSFSSAFWQNVRYASDVDTFWGIPARVDVRMIYYWEDMFDAAGIDPRQAFSAPEAMQDAFSRLRHSIQYPWGVVTERLDHNHVYNPASWIWAEGGNFMSEDGKKLLLNTPEVRRGIRNYLDLAKFIPPEGRNSTNEEVLQLFAERKIAATMQGPWLVSSLKQAVTPAILDLMKVTTPPGPSFIGGTVLVRWKHSRKADLAGKLIKLLSERNFNAAFTASSGALPSHKGSWSDEFLRQNKYNPEYLKGLQNGRSMPSISLWGMIEDRLAQMFSGMWDDLYALNEEPGSAALDKIITKHLEPAANRFEMILSAYHRP